LLLLYVRRRDSGRADQNGQKRIRECLGILHSGNDADYDGECLQKTGCQPTRIGLTVARTTLRCELGKEKVRPIAGAAIKPPWLSFVAASLHGLAEAA